jgi:APA family basic amino acid/polyamine antiporter
VQGSTLVNIILNVIQIAGLLVFSILAIMYRVQHPGIQYLHPSALSVILPHSLGGLVYQSTIAILLIVGFESATALAAETKNPRRDIPRAVILSLLVQAVIFYLFEYFAANFVINNSTQFSGTTSTGFAGAYASGAPIGDIARQVGDALLGGNGTALAVILAFGVVAALIGTSLSCLNTGVRVTYTMGKDAEMPVVFGFLHGRFRTPHVAVIVLTVISAIIGSYGVLNIDNLTQVVLISNIGTFLLYGMTCIVCIVAFAGVKGRSWFSTIVAPFLGAVLNILMLFGVAYYDLLTQGPSYTHDTSIAIGFAVAWLVIGFAYLFIRKLVSGVPILHGEDHKENMKGPIGAAAPVE